MRKVLALLWASPYSLVGLSIGLAVILLGGRCDRREGVLEIGGGALCRLISRLPAPLCFSAITLGHVILGIDQATLAAVRAHEQVHVRQYERWGVFFGPAYLLSSALQLLLGRRPYLDNHFERQAYRRAPDS